MRTILILLCLLSTVLMYGCGTRQVYEGLQSRQRIECQNLPKSEYEECLDRVDVSHEEYKRHREDVKVREKP